MGAIFEAILTQPIFNLFVWIYNLIPDVGIVIFVITLLIKLALFPSTNKSIKAQKDLTELQPKLEALKKKYEGDQQKIATETMALYKEHKVNPFGSCLPLLIQLPVFLALYWVLSSVFEGDNFELLYSFVKNPEHINSVTLGLFDLKENGNIFLALLAGAAQFIQAKMFTRKKTPKEAGPAGKDESMTAMMNKQMLYFMPVITVMIGYQLPGGLALYWFLSTGITALQQVILFRKHNGDGSSKSSDTKVSGVIEGKLSE
ncbi:MAG: YidC/Oxa1 family membrane protein insertase [Patescibacteria group bacterium]|nr:YidC/Oxa1 family membrane protein insertase [Patescibacteria group bacterium]